MSINNHYNNKYAVLSTVVQAGASKLLDTALNSVSSTYATDVLHAGKPTYRQEGGTEYNKVLYDRLEAIQRKEGIFKFKHPSEFNESEVIASNKPFQLPTPYADPRLSPFAGQADISMEDMFGGEDFLEKLKEEAKDRGEEFDTSLPVRGIYTKGSAGTLAHELGHSIYQQGSKNPIMQKLSDLYGLGDLTNSYTMAAATLLPYKLNTLKLLPRKVRRNKVFNAIVGKRPARRAALLHLLFNAPKLGLELHASYKGAQLLNSVDTDNKLSLLDKLSPFQGIPTYAVAAGAPLAGVAIKKPARAAYLKSLKALRRIDPEQLLDNIKYKYDRYMPVFKNTPKKFRSARVLLNVLLSYI